MLFLFRYNVGKFTIESYLIYLAVSENEILEFAQNRYLFHGHTILFPIITVDKPDRWCSVLVEMLPEYVLQACILKEIGNSAFVKTLCSSFKQEELVNLLQLSDDIVTCTDEDNLTPLMW